MNKEYEKTPSFYNDEETFSKFLKKTSFYTTLQNNLCKCIEMSKAKNIVELGSATGETTLKVAKMFPKTTVCGYDMRENIVEVASAAAKREQVSNASFAVCDMVDFAKKKSDADFVYMLYSFHHIVDPEENKKEFLQNLYTNLNSGSYVCIAEGFIPEEANKESEAKLVVDLWKRRSLEASASVFWNSLSSLDKSSIDSSLSIANYSQEKEFEAGKLVADRDSEYLVKASWVEQTAKEIGFEVVINKPVNVLGDRIILLKK